LAAENDIDAVAFSGHTESEVVQSQQGAAPARVISRSRTRMAPPPFTAEISWTEARFAGDQSPWRARCALELSGALVAGGTKIKANACKAMSYEEERQFRVACCRLPPFINENVSARVLILRHD
jgi:hypothetical protein